MARRRLLLLVLSACALLTPAAAQAARVDHGGFHFKSRRFYVHERDRFAVITVVRRNARRAGQVRYSATAITADEVTDFTPVIGELHFNRRQRRRTFRVMIRDHGIPMINLTILLKLSYPYPNGLATPSTSILTIRNDDVFNVVRNPVNPLGLLVAPTNGDPLSGAGFYIDHNFGEAAHQAAAWRSSHPAWARLLDVIGNEPGTHRFGNWDGADPSVDVTQYLDRAATEEPGRVPMISTYRIVYGHCGPHTFSDPPAEQAAYHRFIAGLARGIGVFRAVLFLEMDSLITTPCLSNHGLGVRMSELADAVRVLTKNCPRLAIYLDAGAADAVPAAQIAKMLQRADVAQAQGFFLNATHFDWTSREIRFGDTISGLTGGKHFVVNTGENGQGPLVPHDRVHGGNEVLCNPPGRGLGPVPTASTGYSNVDAFAWTSNPGESGGPCVPGAPGTGQYWPAYAIGLVLHADFKVR